MTDYFKGWNEGMSLEETKNLAYWERNMLAVHFAVYANRLLANHIEYIKMTNPKLSIPDELSEPTCGWYYDTDNDWDGWKRVVSLFEGRMTFHIPDDFDLGSQLPQIEPNWDGHTTEEKWLRVKDSINRDDKL